ncbi:hypothetical protein [Enterococcus devriesei]|uniref:hypothetical protein n=1 Tax=Enterococcus devriesei TaxID=319970 RepID=UPI0036D24AAA
MIKELKNQFMQTAFLTTIWVSLLITLFMPMTSVTLVFIWQIIGIALIAATIFGVLYPYFWQYGTLTAPINILIMTIANFLGGFSSIYLISNEMFELIKPYWWGVLSLTLILHSILFYFYRNHQNKKIAESLNSLTK